MSHGEAEHLAAMPPLPRVVVVGCGALGRNSAWTIESINEQRPQYNLLGFLDEDGSRLGSEVGPYTVLGDLSWLEARPDVLALCALSSPRERARVATRLEAAGVRFATVVSPYALLPKRMQPPRIGEGSMVSCAALDVNVTLGRHTLVHAGAIVGHDSVLGDYATLLPGAIVAGKAVVGAGAVLGSGARVIQRVRVGPGAVVGAGAVVVSDLPPNCTAAGVPARVVRVASGWAEWDQRAPGGTGAEPQRLEAGGGGAESQRTEPAGGAAHPAPRTRL